MDIKRAAATNTNFDIQKADASPSSTPIQADGISSVGDQVESGPMDVISALTQVATEQAKEANQELEQLANRQEEILDQKSKIRDLENQLEKMKGELDEASDKSSFDTLANWMTGNDPGVGEVSDRFKIQTSALGSLFSLSAMHGVPQNYDQLQQVVQDLRDLLNSLPISNEEKLKIQAEINQLDQISHQIPIQPQDPDQNFQDGLALLSKIRSDLAPYAS